MTTRLRKLRINRVDLVDRGANPDADIVLFKREGGDTTNKEAPPMKMEDGVEYPAAAYAYVPDAMKPDTWKLRLWEDAEKKVTAAQVGRAVAALGEGFRGQKVDIPEDDLPGVKARVRLAWKKMHRDGGKEMPEVLKSNSVFTLAGLRDLLGVIGKRLGWTDDEVTKAEMEAMSYQEVMDEQHEERRWSDVSSEMWDCIHSLQHAYHCTLRDETVDREALMRGSLDQFVTQIEHCLPYWLQGKVAMQDAAEVNKEGRKISKERLAALQHMRDMLDSMIADVRADVKADAKVLGDSQSTDQTTMAADMEKKGDSNVSEDVIKRLAELESQIAKMADLEKRAAAAEANVAKAQADLVSAQTANVELAKALEAEREIRVQAEYVKRAADLAPVGMTIAEAADMLRKADTAGFGDALAKSWSSANTALKESDLFKRAGASSRRENANDPWSQIEKAGRDLVSKAGGALNHEQAIAKFLETDEGKRLYSLYESERGAN